MSTLVADSGSSGGTGSLLAVAGLVVLVALIFVVAWMLSRRPSGPAGPLPETVDAPLSLALRLLTGDKETARVRVTSAGQAVDLYLRDGVIYHAVDKTGEGDEVAAKALRWDSSSTTVTVIRGAAMPDNRSVTLPLTGLLNAAGISN